jgi:hypothetical protein
MLVHAVRVSRVVHLEPQGVLQEVARLLIRQPGDNRGPLGDVDDIQLLGLG